jgi:hypothetical protein
MTDQSSIEIGAEKFDHGDKKKPVSPGMSPGTRMDTLGVDSTNATGKIAITDFMKSAYELAMERLEKQAPTAKLTDAQKAAIGEIDSACKAKVAEKEVFLRDQINKARSVGQEDEAASLEKQLAFELRRLADDCEAKKEKIRSSRG